MVDQPMNALYVSFPFGLVSFFRLLGCPLLAELTSKQTKGGLIDFVIDVHSRLLRQLLQLIALGLPQLAQITVALLQL